MVKIFSVIEGSPADRAGIKKDDFLISVNGNNVRDVLDYRFYINEEKIMLKIHRGPELFDVCVEKDEYEDPGLEFETYLMDEKLSCRNKCIFCFIDQLPKGMRDTLYFKDDDSRMSFLSGNYITLTNMSDDDISRIIKLRTSPINISVHTTDPALRCKMMNNRFAGDSLRYIKRLADAEINMNCQIVLCKGINDGKALEKTMESLASYYPYIESVSVVPAGLTKYRNGLYPLEPYSKDECKAIIKQVEKFAKKCEKKYGSKIFFCGDELYIKSNTPLPEEDYYEGYPQIENGVGMTRSLLFEFESELEYLDEYDLEKSRHYSIATGVLAYDFIKGINDTIKKQAKNSESTVYLIENNFFGKEITVAGLLTGIDLYEQLKDKDLGDILFLPSVTLRYEQDMFLDSMTVKELSDKLNVEIRFIDNNGADLISALLY
ncbi:MAG: DUF512 domain-containing protein [Ruminococcaceae bacterium]|nr:DUF512 domain-containing protein [Oscillospiraceae bacterium]